MSAAVTRLLASRTRQLFEGAARQQFLSKVAFSTSNQPPSQPSQTPDGAFVVAFPKLSHTMDKGKLVKWHKQPGDKVNMYDVLFEVATDELTEDEYKEGDFAGTVHLVVEAHEEGWLADVWQPADETKDLQVGTPVGIMCDSESVLEPARRYKCPTDNLYDEKQPRVPMLTWQSFLKSGKREVKCMG